MISYADAQAWLQREYPQVAGGFLPAAPEPAPELTALAEEVFGFLRTKCEAEGRALTGALEALVRMSVDFLRLQPRFMKSGRYGRAGSAELFERFYARREVMEGYYLDGLLLTYAFWVNHARLYRFFVEEFLRGLPREARLVELGVGHGLMALAALRSLPAARYHGFDLSPFSLAYAEGLLRANAVGEGRVSLQQADGVAGLPDGLDARDAAICCEVIEHVEDPAPLLRALRSCLGPGGRAFVTTVANVEAEDHIYLFDDAAHIRRVLEAAGFRVESELPLPLRGFEGARPMPLNYAAVLAPGAIP
jgi:SAM-dependent methyltransferase